VLAKLGIYPATIIAWVLVKQVSQVSQFFLSYLCMCVVCGVHFLMGSIMGIVLQDANGFWFLFYIIVPDIFCFV